MDNTTSLDVTVNGQYVLTVTRMSPGKTVYVSRVRGHMPEYLTGSFTLDELWPLIDRYAQLGGEWDHIRTQHDGL